jgi:hypothetical protein
MFQLIQALLSANTDTIQALLADPGGRVTLQIVVFAGLSESLGHSVILFANRVRPRRFVLSLLLSVVTYVGGFFTWVPSIWAVASLLFNRPESLRDVAAAVSLSYIPLLLGFLTLLPYFGDPIIKGLYLLTNIILISTLSIALQISHSQALVCTLFGAVAILLVRSTVGRPVIWLENRLRDWAAGTPLQRDLNALIETARQQLIQWQNPDEDGDDSGT